MGGGCFGWRISFCEECRPSTLSLLFRLKQSLVADQQGVLHPDVKRKFTSEDETIRKLAKYHVYYEPDLSPKDVEKG